MQIVQYTYACLFGAIGGQAKGFQRARPRVGNMEARFRCLGSIDVDAAANRDFQRFIGTAATTMDLFDREQYIAFHGHEPPPGWREAMPTDIQRAFGNERPDIVFLSAPCKGFSGLLSETKSLTLKYQALNRLTLRGIWLMLEAFAGDPPSLICFENVPRIATRGRHLLDQICDLLRSYGYAVAETTHDCGELGGLAQSRKRFLLVARHTEKVPPFLYEPTKRPLRAVGDVLGKMPLPGAEVAGPMHRVPSLQWKTWVRLAFVEAGSDWRSLNKLAVEDGKLRDFLIVPTSFDGAGMWGVNRWDQPTGAVTSRSGPTNGAHSVADPRGEGMHHRAFGVQPWDEPCGVVPAASRPSNGQHSVADPRHSLYSAGLGVLQWSETAGAVAGESMPSNGRYAVADPRAPAGAEQFGQYGVNRWGDSMGAVINVKSPGQGGYSVADPRTGTKHNNCFRIVQWDRAAGTVTGGGHPSAGGQAVADPRDQHGFAKYAVTGYDQPAGTVISGSTTGQGAFAVADPRRADGKAYGKYAVTQWDKRTGTVIGGDDSGAYAVADPRPNMARGKGDHYLTGGHYGVVPWDRHSYAVASAAGHDNGHWSVADPRPMPEPSDKLIARILSLDGTWHRPFTTLELAALQSLVDPEDTWMPWKMDGESDQAHRERIGNAVPPDAAQAIAEVMGEVLLLARSGETFLLSSRPVWVRPLAMALAVNQK